MTPADPTPSGLLRPQRKTFTRPSARAVGVLGTGSGVPTRILDNADFERMVDTSDEWIVTRTGMKQRRVAAENEATSDLAIEAGRAALESANVAAADIDLVIVATTTPDHATCPPTTCFVQDALGASRAAGFDLNAACTGFVNALASAYGMLASGLYETALVIGADKLSSVVDYADRESCVLFGDGAGAVVLGAGAGRGQLLGFELGIDGSGAGLIRVEAGGSRRPASAETVSAGEHFLQLQGRRVFKFAVAKLCETVERLLERHGATIDDLDLLVPHQANLRILEAAAERLRMPMERVFVNVDRYGNTSAGSVPLALDEAVRGDRIRSGDLVCMCAFGGGLTWGGSLLQW